MNAAVRGRFARMLGAGLLAVSLSPAATALEAGVSVGYQGEYSSNPRRVEDDSRSDIIHRPMIQAAALHSGATTQLSLDYAAHRRIYEEDTFDGETVLEGAARVDWTALPERLTLFAANTRRERSIRTEFEPTPDNLQEQSQTSAGAVLQANLLANHYGTLTYTYSDLHMDGTRTDSSQHGVQAAYVIPRSRTDTIQFIATGTDTDFDDRAAPDYQSVTGMVAYDRVGALTTFGARAGYTSIDRDLSRDTVEGLVGGIDITRQMGVETVVSASYDRAFNDNSLRAAGIASGFDDEVIVGDTDINEVFEQQTARLSYHTRLGVNSLVVAVTGARQKYETDIGRDSDRFATNLTLSRPVRPTVTAFINAGYTRYDYDSADRGDYDQYKASLGFDWAATHRLNVGAEARYYERRTRDEVPPEAPLPNDTAGSRGDLDDWAIIVRLTYLLLGSRAAGLQ